MSPLCDRDIRKRWSLFSFVQLIITHEDLMTQKSIQFDVFISKTKLKKSKIIKNLQLSDIFAIFHFEVFARSLQKFPFKMKDNLKIIVSDIKKKNVKLRIFFSSMRKVISYFSFLYLTIFIFIPDKIIKPQYTTTQLIFKMSFCLPKFSRIGHKNSKKKSFFR